MLNAELKQTLLLGMTPYLSLALYDAWLHERARRVSAAEQAFHGVAFASLMVLMAGLFFDCFWLLLPSIAGFSLASIVDELAFHGGLPRLERGLHFAAYACFAGFITIAFRIGALS